MKNRHLGKRVFFGALLLCVIFSNRDFENYNHIAAFAEAETSDNNLRNKAHATSLSQVTNTPQITFLTHCYGGQASSWSNTFSTEGITSTFAKDNTSLIEKIDNCFDYGVNLYRISNIDDYHIYEGYSTTVMVDSENNEVKKISDFSKHTLIVVEVDTGKPLPEVYQHFEYIVNRLSVDYKEWTNNRLLPRINLIGHSMGGLINLFYTMDHPKNVSSLISLGTPYNGSMYDLPFVASLGIDAFENQKCLTGKCGHPECNIDNRRSRWNSVYANNKHIKFLACSGQVSVDLCQKIVDSGEIGQIYDAEMQKTAEKFVNLSFILPGDVCVDQASQQAEGYDGVVCYNKPFDSTNCVLDKRAVKQLPVPHNLEPHDADIHDVILTELGFKNNHPYSVSNEVTLRLIGLSVDETRVLHPSQWLIELTNNTGMDREFEYNTKACFDFDAACWGGLGDIATTGVIPNGQSTLLAIEENYAGDTLTFSYSDSTNTRKIYYCDRLDEVSKTMRLSSRTIMDPIYTMNGIEVSMLSKHLFTYSFKIRNKTGYSRNFFYNKKLCFLEDAENWNDILDGEEIKLDANESKIITITENAAAGAIAISYVINNYRYVFCANHLDNSLSYRTMSAEAKTIDERVKVEIVSFNDNTDTWRLKVTNNTGSSQTFYYNSKMCFGADAESWDGLKDVASISIANGQSKDIYITENGTARYIGLCFIENGYRNIIYSYDLDEDGTLDVYRTKKALNYYSKNNIGVAIIGQNGDNWILSLKNYSSSKYFYYYPEFIGKNNAYGWNFTKASARSVYLSSGSETIITIQDKDNGSGIGISYKSGNDRYVFFGDDLDNDCTMDVEGSIRNETIKADIISKSGSTWNIRLTNNTGATRTFYYNKRMCLKGDAETFTGLSDVGYITLSNNSSQTIYITENGASRYITMCYIEGNYKNIFYAYDLSPNGGMISYRATVSTNAQNLNGLKVAIAGKDDNKWVFHVTNTSGTSQNIYYNSYLVYEPSASKWSVSDVASPKYVSNGGSTTIVISEDNPRGTMAMSYVDSSNYRHIFYAYNLSKSSSMTAKSSTINLNSSSSSDDDNCVVTGTMITLADGTKKAVEDLTGDEMLLVWNFETGTYDSAPILFIDSDPEALYNVIKLTFSDGTTVNVVTEHGFYDTTINEYIYLGATANDYIGHNFIKCDGNSYTEVTLTEVEIKEEVTTTYSPVTYGHLCYYVNDMLSMPGGISGLFNYFDVDPETMKYDEEAMANDIETYGLLTYEELYEFAPVSREMFDAVNGQYLKIALGKGLITSEDIEYLAKRYSSFVPEETNNEENQNSSNATQSLKESVIKLLKEYGYTIEELAIRCLRTYLGPVFGAKLSNVTWDASFDGNYYTISISASLYGINFQFIVRIR